MTRMSKSGAVALLTLSFVVGSGPAAARFLSVDPAPPNGATGTNFNRYDYANNNPFKFTDPDGRTVVFGGDDLEKKTYNEMDRAVKASNPELKGKLEALEKDKTVHVVEPTRFNHEPGNEGQTLTVPTKGTGTNGSKADTVTYMDTSGLVKGKGAADPAGVFTHEVTGHAYDDAMGKNEDAAHAMDPATGGAKREERAIYMEQLYHDGVKDGQVPGNPPSCCDAPLDHHQ